MSYVRDRPVGKTPPDKEKLTKEFLKESNTTDYNFARDMLEGTKWSLNEALAAYKSFSSGGETSQPVKYGAPECPSSRPTTGSVDRWRTRLIKNDNPKELGRGFSIIANQDPSAVAQQTNLLNSISENIQKQGEDQTDSRSRSGMIEGAGCTFVLPNLSSLPHDFRTYVEKKLLDLPTLKMLESTGHLNWWVDHSISKRLLPMYTTGDGNCLLHAASLAMIGRQDRQLHLRGALHQKLEREKKGSPLYRRWRWQQAQEHKEMGLVLSEEEWEQEWRGLINLASTTPKVYETTDRIDGHKTTEKYFESLEELHVYLLSQIIKRPIIVFAEPVLKDVEGQAMAPIPFGGIYLPLEHNPEKCHKSPLMLAYDRGHFSAVVPMLETDPKHKNAATTAKLVPLTGSTCGLLTMHFIVDPGADVNWANLPDDHYTIMDIIEKIKAYLLVETIPMSSRKPSSDSSDSSLDRKEKSGLMRKLKHKKSKLVTEEPMDMIEPGEDLIMCAELNIKITDVNLKMARKYIDERRKEFDKIPQEPKHDGHHSNNHDKKSKTNWYSEAAEAGGSGQTYHQPKMCSHCAREAGTPEQNGLCLKCYEIELLELNKRWNDEDEESERQHVLLCPQCQRVRGRTECKGYCAYCYNSFFNKTSSNNVKQEETYLRQQPTAKPRHAYSEKEYRIPVNFESEGAEHEMGMQALQIQNYDREPRTTTYSSHGSTEATLPYDRTYDDSLRRSPPTDRRTATMSLGMDGQAGNGALRMTSSSSGVRPAHYSNTSRISQNQHRKPESLQRVTSTRRSPDICRNPNCRRSVYVMGLCSNCYQTYGPQMRLLLHQGMNMKCRLTGCTRAADTNQGFCSQCIEAGRRKTAASNKFNHNFSY